LTGLIALAIGAGIVVRQTQAAPLSELFGLLNRTLRPNQQKIDPQQSEQQNPALATARIIEMEQRLVEAEAENIKLKELLGFKEKVKGQPIPAAVIGRSGDHWWQQVTLNLGQNAGIAENQIVMAPGGVVGYIESVTPNTSRVLLISDPNSQTGVVVSRSRETGYMRGIGNNRAMMEFFDKVPDVRKGDVVAISSFSKKYPKGLPIGRVLEVDDRKSPAPEATIELSAPIRNLEWVLVYPAPPILDTAPEAKPTKTPASNINSAPSPGAAISPNAVPSPSASPNPRPTQQP
jgi:rod shape-determining protein MreC